MDTVQTPVIAVVYLKTVFVVSEPWKPATATATEGRKNIYKKTPAEKRMLHSGAVGKLEYKKKNNIK